MQQNRWETAPIVGKVPASGNVPIYGIVSPKAARDARDQELQEEAAFRDAERLRLAQIAAAKPDPPRNIQFAPKDAGGIVNPDGTISAMPQMPKPTLSSEEQDAIRREALDKIKLGAGLVKRSRNTMFGTGFGAGTAVKYGGNASGAGGIATDTETLRSAGALQRIMEMSERTGKNLLTPISNTDFKALGDSVANLDPTQPDDQYQRNVGRVIEIYKRAYTNAGGDPIDLAPFLKDIPGLQVEVSEFNKGMNDIVGDQRIPKAQRFQKAMDYAQSVGRQVNQDQLKAAIEVGRGNVVEDPKFVPPGGRPPEGGRSTMRQLGDAAVNTGAALVQGGASGLDMIADAGNAVLSVPARALGMNRVADRLLNNPGYSDLVERVAPTPQDTAGRVVRFAGQLAGGAASMPRKGVSALTEAFIGKGPPAIPPALVRPQNRQVMRDARDMGIDLMPASVGGPTTNILTSVMKQTPGGAYPIVNRARTMLAQGGEALQKLAGRDGIVNAERMGERATKGALSYRGSSRDAANEVFRAAYKASDGIKIVPKRGIGELDAKLAEYAKIPMGKDGAKYLAELRDELVNKFPDGVTIEGLRGMRTQLRDKFYKDGLRGSAIERDVNGVVARINDDMTLELANAGKGKAADLFRKADAMWTERATVLDDFIMPIIGKKGERSGEQVAKALTAAAKGNGARFQRFVGALPAEEVATVRGTIINGLGKAKAGAQNAEGDAFSFDTLLTNWNDIGPTARKALFSRGDQAGMDKLIRVAERAKESGKFTNYSNTGLSVMGAATGSSALAGPAAFLGVLAGQYTVGRILASPGAAAMLAKVVESRSPQTAAQSIKQLSVIAARNPALAEDVASLQQRLAEAFIQSPASRAAAEQK